MCNLYSITSSQEVRRLARTIRDITGNQPPLPGVFPDYLAPIARNNQGTRELATARWGMPSPVFALKGRNADGGVNNVRNVKSPHWRRWLGVESRCLVPFNSFSEKLERKFGWGGRDRTSVWRNQNPLPYRLATPQSAAPYSRGNLPPQQLAQSFSDDYKLGSSVGV